VNRLMRLTMYDIGAAMLTILSQQFVSNERIIIMLPVEVIVAGVVVCILGVGYLGYRYGLRVKAKVDAAIHKVEDEVKKL
jgi:biotin transporter BioY